MQAVLDAFLLIFQSGIMIEGIWALTLNITVVIFRVSLHSFGGCGHTQRRVPIGWSVTTRNYHGVPIGRNPRSLIYNFAKRSHIMMVQWLCYLTKALQAALLKRPARVRSGSGGSPLVRPPATGSTTGCLYFTW